MGVYIINNIVINLLAQCTKCGSPVTDSIESEIGQHGKIKSGNYINGIWICDDCLGTERKEEEKEYSSSYKNQNNNSNNQCDDIGLASKSDLSPNTPRADEANL
jgi:Zn-finger protein